MLQCKASPIKQGGALPSEAEGCWFDPSQSHQPLKQMYSEIPLWLSLVFIAVGLVALAWSSDTFVDGAATIAKVLGISPFISFMKRRNIRRSK